MTRRVGLHAVRWTAILVVVLALSGQTVVSDGSSPSLQGAQPRNVRLMTEVWGAFERREYAEAAKLATALIEDFEPMASYRQHQLLETEAPGHPTGVVVGEDKEKIFRLGVLNDVAAAWWLKARAYYLMGDKQKAIEAYEKVIQYPHARVYDPAYDGFWSPAEDAKARLEFLKQR